MEPLPLNQKSLEELNKQCRYLNVFPLYLPEYFREKRNNPITPLLIELVKECVDWLSAMNKSEIQALISALPPGISMFVAYDDFSDFSSREYLERLSLYYLVGELSRIYLNFDDIINSRIENSLAITQYPELKSKIDKDGLLVLDDELELHDCGIIYKEHILHYHQFLRRGFTSNPNFDFLGRFISYFFQSKEVNTFRIAIDPVRLMPKEFLQHIAEFDAWFGPNFDRNELDNTKSIGLTVKKRHKPSIFDLTDRLDRTEFYWSLRDSVKTLEIEELSELDFNFDNFNINRYVHSERDIDRKVLQHFDGAVRIYQNDYNRRLATQFPNEHKSDKYIKLFRIDGVIDVDWWLDLIAFFYKGNEMILEYFDPIKYQAQFGKIIREYEQIKNK